jgi:signal transduction histidine kinase
MRIVTKINLALAAVVGLSALLNLAALETTVMPRFSALEIEAAQRNQSRVLEAIQLQEAQVAASARDYAFWDDSYAYMNAGDPTYETKNVNAESLKALNVNHFLAVDAAGRVKLDRGFDFSGEDPVEVRLLDVAELPQDHPFRAPFAEPESRTGLIRTEQGVVALGYAPITNTERKGDPSGILLFGRLIDLDLLRTITKVDFDLVAASAGPRKNELTRGESAITVRTTLAGVDGKPIADIVSTTSRSISAAGRQAVWTAMLLILAAGALLILTLAIVLRRIAVKRIERMQRHLVRISATGSLEPLPEEDSGDELSRMVTSFNEMAAQLAELREQLRRRDYRHGAADQAAEMLHNVRNAVSPLSAIAWELAQEAEAPLKANLAKALQQLEDPSVEPARVEKLNQFVALSAGRLLEEERRRQSELKTLQGIVQHVEGILKDEEAVAHGERKPEEIELRRTVAAVAAVIRKRPGMTVSVEAPPGLSILGHQIALEQIVGNLMINAAEAIEATGRGAGTIKISAQEIELNGAAAVDLRIEDDGDGIPAERLEKVFEKGYSTRRERSGGLGLHWCANAANAMHGRLYAESEGAGRGATFHLVLPRASKELRTAA